MIRETQIITNQRQKKILNYCILMTWVLVAGFTSRSVLGLDKTDPCYKPLFEYCSPQTEAGRPPTPQDIEDCINAMVKSRPELCSRLKDKKFKDNDERRQSSYLLKEELLPLSVSIVGDVDPKSGKVKFNDSGYASALRLHFNEILRLLAHFIHIDLKVLSIVLLAIISFIFTHLAVWVGVLLANGVSGLAALLPIHNLVLICKGSSLPASYAWLLLIPGLNIPAYLYLLFRYCHRLGRGWGSASAAFFFPPLLWFFMGTKKSPS